VRRENHEVGAAKTEKRSAPVCLLIGFVDLNVDGSEKGIGETFLGKFPGRF
jgi:hypothetical protein